MDVLQQSEELFACYAKEQLLKSIKETLASYGITFDVWFSEKALHDSGAIDRALALLEKKGYTYEKENALWFTSTNFGDDKDRVLRKSDGSLTYIAADVAYLNNKIERHFDTMIYILGHDHHSYKARLQAVHQALESTNTTVEVLFYQLVKMKVQGQMVRMSKRAGNIVTLHDVIETVGTDVARFFYLHRKADGQLEFDVNLALKHTDENPVFYIQYAYVRTNSILKKGALVEGLHNIDSNDIRYLSDDEKLLIKKIVSLKSLLNTIATTYQTHQLTYYTIELANLFHSYYSKHRVVDPDNINQSRGRLLLITLLNRTLHMAFTLLGISSPEKM